MHLSFVNELTVDVRRGGNVCSNSSFLFFLIVKVCIMIQV